MSEASALRQAGDSAPGVASTRLLAGVAVTGFLIAVLYVGRDVLVPLALAVLLSFLLAPLVRIMQRGVGRAAAVVLAVTLAFASFLLVAAVMMIQLSDLAQSFPTYQSTMIDKIRGLRESFAGAGSIERLMELVNRLAEELRPSGGAQNPSVPVVVRESDAGPFAIAGQVLAPLLKPLLTVGLVLLFAIFILLQREDLRNRFIRLAGSHDMQRTTSAIDDAAQRLSRLFLTQSALNAAYGVVIAAGLSLIGLPSAILFGILAGVLRFVPYVGAIVGAVLPIALAAMVDPGWQTAVLVTLLFVIVEPLVGHVIEPLLYGRSTGLSPVAVVVSVTFWTTLWGPIGLLLATPLTVCLVVVGRHVEQLGFLEVALGDRPPLSEPQVFYQRLLAGDPEDALAQADTTIQRDGLPAFMDTVAVPALLIARDDLDRDAMDGRRLHRFLGAVELFSGLTAAPAVEPGEDAPLVTIFAGGRSPVDEAAALLLRQTLEAEGHRCIIKRLDGRSEERALGAGQPPAVALVAFVSRPLSPPSARYRIRRLKAIWPTARLVVVALGAPDREALAATIPQAGEICVSVNSLVTTLRPDPKTVDIPAPSPAQLGKSADTAIPSTPSLAI